jgi:hypothetical protein
MAIFPELQSGGYRRRPEAHTGRRGAVIPEERW